MKKTISNVNRIVALQLAIMIGIYWTSSLHGLPILIMAKYMCFQLFCIAVPGYAVVMACNQKHSLLCDIVLSYAFGIFALIIEYLVTISLGISSLVIAICVSSLGLIYLIYLIYVHFIKDYHHVVLLDWEYLVFLILLLLALYVICLFCVSARYTFPNESHHVNYYPDDYLFWVGNTVSLSKSFPPQNIRMVGELLYYHYFSSIIVAQTFRITGISIQILSFYFSYILPIFMMVTSIAWLTEILIKTRVLKIVVLIGVLLSEGSSLTYASHLYFNPFGYDYGFFFGITSICWLIEMVDKKDVSAKSQIIAAILISMVTGCKAPVAVVVLMGYFVYGVYLLIHEKIAVAFFCGGVWLTPFITNLILFVYGFNVSKNGAGLQFLGLRDAWQNNPWAQYLFNNNAWIFGKGKVGILVSLAQYVLNINYGATIGLLLIILGICFLLIYRRTVNIKLIMFAMIMIFGIVLTLITNQVGGSQMYFAMSAIPFGIVGGVYSTEQIFEYSNKLSINMFLVQFVGITLGVYIFLFGPAHDVFNSVDSYGRAIAKMYQGYVVYNSGAAGGMTSDECNGYLWVKENTDTNAVFAIDKECNDERTFQEIIAFGERYTWNEGMYDFSGEAEKRNEKLQSLLKGDNINRSLQCNGIDYLIVPKSSYNVDNISSQCKLEYKCNTYYIFRISES